jgi:predicted helicase
MSIAQYLAEVRRVYAGEPTEHSYRMALVQLLEAIGDGVVATNEPQHRRDCGAPDIKVAVGDAATALTIGYVECKNIGISLDEAAKSEQLTRYRENLPNLLLTDYLELRWFVEGQERCRARFGYVDSTGKIVSDSAGRRAAWQILEQFVASAPQPVASPEELAGHMARLTRMIRDIIARAFDREQASTTTDGLLEAFRKTLLPKIEPTEFADMFAQTLAYGLFAARVNHRDSEGPFERIGAARDIPRTNPFLRDLFDSITGVALDDEPYVGFVDDLTTLLRTADMGQILAQFGARSRGEDPIVHFYETFLAKYDPKLRDRRGVYYTPDPVVSYIVRSVDWVLREHFGLSEGLADQSTVQYKANLLDGSTESRTSHRVLVLDPACGTGTFLYHVIDHIRDSFIASNNAGMWPGFVEKHLLPRLFGFELLMAPYAVAHLKLGMQLAAMDMSPAGQQKWGVEIPPEQRLNIYLTNTLEEAEQVAQTQFGIMQALAEETNAASDVKRDMPIMVMLGNPPYAVHSANKGAWIDGLLKGRLPDGTETDSYYEVDGKPLGERNPKMLQDDYVKFIRWAQWRIKQTGAGVLAFITNHGYLDNPTFRGMRHSLLQAFDHIYILNLHGNSLKKETAPDGTADMNVFDIRVGTAILICVRKEKHQGPAVVEYADLWGPRARKYAALLEQDVSCMASETLAPSAPAYLMVPFDDQFASEYESGPSITAILPVCSNGVKTHRDHFVTDFDESVLAQRLEDFADLSVTDAEVAQRFRLSDTRAWSLSSARRALVGTPDRTQLIREFLYRPFDARRIAYHEALLDRPRTEVMRHMLAGPNLAFITTRQTRDPWAVLAVAYVITHKALAAYDTNSLFPLYLYPDPARLGETESEWPPGKDGRTPNLGKAFVDSFAAKLGMSFVSDGRGDLQHSFGPEDIFDYIYAVFHCPTYRQRYAEFLKIDFPRVPLTSDPELFADLIDLGGQLVRLHLMEDSAIGQPITTYPVPGDNSVERAHPKYYAPGEMAPTEAAVPLPKGRVYISGTKRKTASKPAQYFEGIPPQVWEFQVGGYQVLDKWLKDRRGRALTQDDLEHYQRIVVALSRTIELMEQIDARIGAWPMQ